MKTLLLSKFSILMITLVIFSLVVYAIIAYSSPSTVSKENERIYLSWYDQNHPDGYVKISDMAEDSAGYFTYPSSFNASNHPDAYQSFLLIRLSASQGGGSDNVSSFRAYSRLDLTSHCLLHYWSRYGPPRIEDSCSGDAYRPIDGYLYTIGGSPILLRDNALPRLDLVDDKNGFLYVIPPTWTEDKNGVVGIGRKIPNDAVTQASDFLIQQENLMSKQQNKSFTAPAKLVSGESITSIDSDPDGGERVYYQNPDHPENQILLIDRNCNCENYDYLIRSDVTTHSELWGFHDHLILATPNSVGIAGSSHYIFEFYLNHYKIILVTDKTFSDGMKVVLDNFFNGTIISDLQRIPIK